jgi:hypothetical protein
MAVQWVHLGADQVLVASGKGAWLQRPELGLLPFAGPMPEGLPATRTTMSNLLDGAIVAAERDAGASAPPPMTAVRWAWDLLTQWYCAHHSVALLVEAVERFEQLERSDLFSFARHRLEEERGHDQFPLRDLRALGYDAEPLVHEVAPAPRAIALIKYARASVRGEHPVEFLGYIHSQERHVLRVTPSWFAELQGTLGGVQADSGLRAHATELDVKHVEEAVDFFTCLPAADRTRIALACYQTSLVRNTQPTAPDPSDAELASRLSAFNDEAANEEMSSTRSI